MTTLKAKINGVWTLIGMVVDPRAPRRFIGQVAGTATTNVGAAATDLTGLSIAWTSDPSRQYLATVTISVKQNTAAGLVSMNITTAPVGSAGTAIQASFAINEQKVMALQLPISGLSGAQTVKVTGTTSAGTADFLSVAGSRAYLVLQDIGSVSP